jgi:two-component system LytT family sensor kinase
MSSSRLRGIARFYALSFLFWFGVALLMGLQYLPFAKPNVARWFRELFVEVTLRGLNLGFWTPPIFYLVGRFVSSSRGRVWYVFLWSLGAVPFVLLHNTLLWVLIPNYDPPTQTYIPRTFQSWWDLIRTGFADQMFIYISIVVAAHAYEYLKRLRREERERLEHQQALAASELQALKMQIHPHFLFNTLNGISTLVDVDACKAKAMIVKLSSLLRAALDSDSSDLIALEAELKFIREYLDLEKMRFGDRLKIEWRVAPEASRVLVPQMILQPLVENAIRHGIAASREAGWVEVAASANDGRLYIHVRNNAGGKSANGTGLGLRNVEARIKYL